MIHHHSPGWWVMTFKNIRWRLKVVTVTYISFGSNFVKWSGSEKGKLGSATKLLNNVSDNITLVGGSWPTIAYQEVGRSAPTSILECNSHKIKIHVYWTFWILSSQSLLNLFGWEMYAFQRYQQPCSNLSIVCHNVYHVT
jgi:hypothetical protein